MSKHRQGLKTVLAILLAVVGVLVFTLSDREALPGADCIVALRLKSASNPILMRLEVPMDSIASIELKRYRVLSKDTAIVYDRAVGRIILCTSDSMDGFFTDYARDRVLTDGVAWGNVVFYRFRIREGVLSVMSGSTTIAISGTTSNPVPPWEEFDSYAVAHMRQIGILNEQCQTVDSVLLFGDVNGNPASRTFHVR